MDFRLPPCVKTRRHNMDFGNISQYLSMRYLLQKNDFHILNDIVWFKPNAAPSLSCHFFTASHETILWTRKDKKAKHMFNYRKMKNGNFPEDKLK
jgi:site-specific DNA-methyltransferase (adenine-specific)